VKVYVVNWATADDVDAARDDGDYLAESLGEPSFTDVFVGSFTDYDLAQVQADVEDQVAQYHGLGKDLSAATWTQCLTQTVGGRMVGRYEYRIEAGAGDPDAWVVIVAVDMDLAR
jgi:hypothetical protein